MKRFLEGRPAVAAPGLKLREESADGAPSKSGSLPVQYQPRLQAQ
jgi:hypothetical protein